MKSAVLFLVFNRPDTTHKVFEAIRAAKPPRLYVAADGPRLNREGEQERCEEVRKIATAINWPCELKTLLRDDNLGCKRGVSEGINWFFENEEQGIILEDDCLPAQSFFLLCDELLELYKEDTRIWQISGSMFFPKGIVDIDADYIFSRYGPIWGWASWRRAWRHYDADLTQWKEMSQPAIIKNVYPNKHERVAKLILGTKLHNREIDTWDYQWGFAKNYNNALTILPKFNQIVNIGFGKDATHTFSFSENAPKINQEINHAINKPKYIYENIVYGDHFAKNVFKRNDKLLNALIKIKSYIKKVI
jgi:hypothetical protein